MSSNYVCYLFEWIGRGPSSLVSRKRTLRPSWRWHCFGPSKYANNYLRFTRKKKEINIADSISRNFCEMKKLWPFLQTDHIIHWSILEVSYQRPWFCTKSNLTKDATVLTNTILYSTLSKYIKFTTSYHFGKYVKVLFSNLLENVWKRIFGFQQLGLFVREAQLWSQLVYCLFHERKWVPSPRYRCKKDGGFIFTSKIINDSKMY